MLSRLLPKFTENMTPRALAAALNNLVDALGRLTGFRSPASPLGQMPDGTLYLDDTQYKRIPARLTAMKSVAIGDNQPAQLRHAFIQQVFDPTTGLYSDFTSGLIGDGALTYATELNNGTLGPLTATIPAAAGTGPLVWLRSKGIVSGNKVYEFDIGTNALAWVAATSATPTEVFLGRTVTDGILSGTVFTSDTASFTSDDVGATLIGAGISGGTTISSVLDSTTVLMSASASSGSGVTVQIVTGSIKAYAAAIESESTKTGDWAGGQSVWLQQANDSIWQALVGGVEPILVPVVSGQIYQCRYFTTDASNVPIWTVAEVDNTQLLDAGASSVSLSSSWTTVTGLSLTIPPGQTWKATVTVTATITSSASGTGDSVSFRLMDSSSTQWGQTMTGCNAVCDSISFTDCVAVQGTGSGGVTLNVQAIINTSSGSTATMTLGSIIATTL